MGEGGEGGGLGKLYILFAMKRFLKRLRIVTSKNKFQAFSCLILLLPLVVYLINFWSHSFSDDPAMWGAFGDYIGGVYNVLVAMLVFYISHNLDRREEKYHKKAKAAYDIKCQIEKFESSGNKTKAIERLTNLILSNKDILGQPLYRMLLALNDHFQHVINDGAPINNQQRTEVIEALNSVYDE